MSTNELSQLLNQFAEVLAKMADAVREKWQCEKIVLMVDSLRLIDAWQPPAPASAGHDTHAAS